MKFLLAFALFFPALPLFAEKWEKDIVALEAKAKAADHPKGGLVFVGSSSIRMWDLQKSFPGKTAINQGFGGSELADSLKFADRLVMPFEPKAVFLYAGDNDIANGKSAEVVVVDFKKFAAKVHAALPKTEIVFLPVKPSLSRWNLWPEMSKANLAIKEFAGAHKHLDYLDTATPMLGEDGKPKGELFKDDGLHMSWEGYLIWNRVVNDWLAKRK